METDAELVQRTLADDKEAFRLLVERYQDAVFGVALSRTRSFADAEDIAQETFVSAFRSLSQLRDSSGFGGWLYRIGIMKVREHLRRRKAHSEPLEVIELQKDPEDSPDEAASRQETRSLVMRALSSLPHANREAATLYYIDGYSQKDISRFTAVRWAR